MSLLKCLEDFVPSESGVYSEEEMREINIRILQERGVTVDDIAQLAYSTQSKYLDNLTIDEMKASVLDVLGKRDQFHAILLAANVDVAAEQNLALMKLLHYRSQAIMEPLDKPILVFLMLANLEKLIFCKTTKKDAIAF